MKKIFALVAVAFSLSVWSREEVSFSYSGMESWGQSYYSCDYVENQTEKVLEMFGATNIDVWCTGGIEFGRIWTPVSVSSSFDVPLLTGAEATIVKKYRGDSWNPSCGLNVAIVKALLPKFINVKVLRKSDSCGFANSNFSYEFEITK
jgi:hypothetical protein